MHHVVMGINALLGFQRGHFKELDHLFFVDYEYDLDGSTHSVWTDNLGEAKRFGTADEAWDVMNRIYGLDFSRGAFAVLAIRAEGIREAQRDIPFVTELPQVMTIDDQTTGV